MGSFKLQSFEDFSTASKAAAEAKIQEEQKSARRDAAYQFETLLSEFGVTSVKDLSEEDRSKFFTKLGASEISESVAIIEEGTRSQVGKIGKNGKITSVYMHYDGYPDHMLPTIKKGYKDGKNVDILLKKGGGSGLEADPAKINFYGDKATTQGNVKNIKKYIKDAEYDGGAEFVYLFDERDGKWYMADTYEDQDLKPAFESVNDLIINEKFVPSKGNLRDAKKVANKLEQIMTSAPALTDDDTTHFGAVRYLLQNALEDANFHSYIEPVGKALGGKIRTINVKINNLGDMEIPVGAKTIQKFLDSHYSDLSNAAGWSGIGIVEGVALYLDGWGFNKAAQKMVDKFNFIYANESVANEGNAFLAARAKAIEEDAEEFEFNGKTYPVIKEAEEVIVEKDDAGTHLDKIAELVGNARDFFAIGKELDKGGYKGKYFYSDTMMPMYQVEVDGFKIGIINKKYVDKGDREVGSTAIGLMESSVNESLHPKLKKAMKAVNQGKTVYGENIRFPGRFKIVKMDQLFTTVDYEDGTDPFDMASMNIRIDSLQFESVEIEEGNAFGAARAEAIAKGEKTFKVGDEEYDVESVDAEDKENAEEFANESEVNELKKGDVVKFEDGSEIHILGPKGDGYDYKDGREKGHHPKGWFDMMLSSGKATIKENEETFKESVTNEAEVKSDEDFKEYAFSVLQKAFGDDFDETKAQEVVDGLLSKHGEDYGAMVGALQASMG